LGNLLGGLCLDQIVNSLPNAATTVKLLGDIFSANKGPGVLAMKVSGLAMTGSLVGTDETSATGLGNTDGLKLQGLLSSVIGDHSLVSNLLNVIAGNTGKGISFESLSGSLSDLNKVFGTYVGTDLDGKAGLGNGGC